MGFYSWNTCDSQTSIPAEASGRPMQPVYMLQPDGQAPIKEECYEGYGFFGGMDAYEWLTKANAEALSIDLSKYNDVEVTLIGIQLHHGSVCEDVSSGELWHVFHDGRALVKGRYFKGTYAEIIPEYGASANQLMEDGRFKMVRVSDVVGLPYPLKFSFNPEAIYENYSGSTICPDQGYFYEDGGAEI